ncbi:MAG: cytochrome C [Gammaproteobacteria bacterium]|nr:cytochrome C [Gammaproteobacteria bacterium]NNJ85182.1 cytochrome C [Gammaproteobacteria bacterium]
MRIALSLFVLATGVPFAVAAAEPSPSGAIIASGVIVGRPAVGSDVERFRGYAGAPDFEVVSRKKRLRLYPCTTCHRFLPTRTTPRKLVTALPHPHTLRHGKGRLWCFECHDLQNKNALHVMAGGGVAGGGIDFDQEHLLCGQCHYNRHQDWYFGAHGKRLDNWRGKRKLVLCSHCHDPHDTVPKPRKPREKPPVRIGLDPMMKPVITEKQQWNKP